VTLDDLRDALGRELTRDDIRQLEILAAFEGFDTREFLQGDRYAFIKRSGRRPRKRRAYRRTGLTAGMTVADRIRTLRTAAEALGLCTNCRGVRARPERKTCARCARRKLRSAAGPGLAARRRRQRRANTRLRTRLAAEKTCARCCKRPARDERTTCEVCAGAESVRHRARYLARHPGAASRRRGVVA